MEENKDNRVLRVELDDEVKKVSVTGLGSDEKVVMRQELSDVLSSTCRQGALPHC